MRIVMLGIVAALAILFTVGVPGVNAQSVPANVTFTGFTDNAQPFFSGVFDLSKNIDYTREVYFNNSTHGMEIIITPDHGNATPKYSAMSISFNPYTPGHAWSSNGTINFNNATVSGSYYMGLQLAYVNDRLEISHYDYQYNLFYDYAIMDNSPEHAIIEISTIILIVALILSGLWLWQRYKRPSAVTKKEKKKNVRSKGLKADGAAVLKDAGEAATPAWYRGMPGALAYTILLFIATRIVLTLVGALVTHDTTLAGMLNMWGHGWDSKTYVGLARYGYDYFSSAVGGPDQLLLNFAYFPLYPLLIRMLSFLIADYQIAGLIVSNACLFISCYYLYKLVTLDADEQTGRRAVKYMLLFPTAFILSTVLTESLFLALSIACVYYAKKHSWLPAGILGGLAATSRSVGILLFIPVAMEYMKAADYKLSRVMADALAVLVVPLGLLACMLYGYFISGDFLVFITAESTQGSSANPLYQLLMYLTHGPLNTLVNGYMTLAALAVLIAYYKKIDYTWLVYGLFLILVPLSNPSGIWSMTRYLLVVFPLYIIGARLGANKKVDLIISAMLFGAQLLLMATFAMHGYYVR